MLVGWLVGVLVICGVFTVGFWTVVVENEGVFVVVVVFVMILFVVIVVVGVRRVVSVV